MPESPAFRRGEYVKDVMKFISMVQASFSDAGNWVIVMVLWIVAFGGVMSSMDAFGAAAGLVVKFARNVRHSCSRTVFCA